MGQVLNLAVTLSPHPSTMMKQTCLTMKINMPQENKMPQERMRQKTLGPIDSFLHSLNLQITVENLGLIWSGYLQLNF